MTTRDEYEKRKKELLRRAHLRVYQGLSEKPEPQAPKETVESPVLLVISRDQLGQLVRLAQWGRKARLALQAAVWSLCSFALIVGLLRILVHFRK